MPNWCVKCMDRSVEFGYHNLCSLCENDGHRRSMRLYPYPKPWNKPPEQMQATTA